MTYLALTKKKNLVWTMKDLKAIQAVTDGNFSMC